MDGATHYELLGLDPSAGPEVVRAAYRRVSARVHPDAGGTAALFRQVHEAYATLGDPVRRAAYDDRLRPGAANAAGTDRVPPWSEPAGPCPPGAAPVHVPWPARHPSAVVTAGGVSVLYLGVVLVNGLAVVGALAVFLGLVGLLGSGRARAQDTARGAEAPTGAVARFAGDLRWGIPRVARFVAVLVVLWVVRAEFRRATGAGRR